MTYDGDFIPNDQAFDPTPDYPVVFGLRLTPTVSGVLLGLAGLAGAGALAYYLLLPAWDENQQLKAKVEQAKVEVQQQQAIAQTIDKAKKDLASAQQQKADVLTLFANENTLNTLLLDINRQIDARNADLAKRREQRLAGCSAAVRSNLREFEEKYGEIAAKAELKKFAPNRELTGVITDGSYGTQVDNKLKRQTVNVEFAGNYEQTAAILQSIERLQPLLVVRNLQSTLGDKVQNTTFFQGTGDFARLSPCQPDAKLTTKFQLEALLPLTAAEAAKANPPQPAAQPQQ